MKETNEIKVKEPILKLSGIGKIYVSEGNVAVGIRGVSLSFERGEFVAVTGKSGSGKSTLLNVISGMDTYEEGELFVEGNPTSHYLQKDWEEYRRKYISFIFQDYNIIDSFSVLENVELALMNIPDLRERRRRAVELIKRVGLEKHMNHKGSKLSGGQKQRTVIARALAKDSPVILADEPTGNLDSQTSAEIVDLLKEVSKDKLVIVVTHNYEQLENAATRHIRIFDGAVESDSATGIAPTAVETSPVSETPDVSDQSRSGLLKNGFSLGKAIFAAKPKLTVFLCLLLFVGTAGIFLATSLCGEAFEIFRPNYMFTPSEGRVIITRTDGAPIADDELRALAGSAGFVHYDSLFDAGLPVSIDEIAWRAEVDSYISFSVKTDASGVRISAGRLPESPDEAFLLLPIGYKPYFGTGTVKIDKLPVYFEPQTVLTVCGVGYYADNNLTPVMFVTEKGFDYLTVCYHIAEGNISSEGILKTYDSAFSGPYYENIDLDAARKALSLRYKQASLFYGTDKEAAGQLKNLRDKGYIAAMSDSTYEPAVFEIIEQVIEAVIAMFLWLASLLFLAFFIHLCTSRSVAAFRPDMAIMRSMGIPANVIRAGIFIRMLLSILPAFAGVAAISVLIFTTPAMNARFTYLYAWQYVMIFAGTFILVLLVTRRQIKKLFGDSVKKAIRGGDAA